jgi:hypothetical protein
MPLTEAGRQAGLAKMHEAQKVRKELKLEDLKAKSGAMLSIITEYLLEVNPKTGEERMLDLLRESKLKDISVVYGIMTEKFLLTQGQPTTIVGHNEQLHTDKLMDALQEEWAKRKALSHRPVTVEVLHSEQVSNQ